MGSMTLVLLHMLVRVVALVLLWMGEVIALPVVYMFMSVFAWVLVYDVACYDMLFLR